MTAENELAFVDYLVGRVKMVHSKYGYALVHGTHPDLQANVIIPAHLARGRLVDNEAIGAFVVMENVVRDHRGWVAGKLMHVQFPDENWLTGTGKFFSTAKGYGFVAVPGMRKDVFVHNEVVNKCGREAIMGGGWVGRVFDVVVYEGDKGICARRIRVKKGT